VFATAIHLKPRLFVGKAMSLIVERNPI
jgi:hypothetical protein